MSDTAFSIAKCINFSTIFVLIPGASIRRKRDPSALYDLQRRLIRSYRNSYKNSHSASSSQHGTVGSGHAEGVMPSPEDGIMLPNNPFLTGMCIEQSFPKKRGKLTVKIYPLVAQSSSNQAKAKKFGNHILSCNSLNRFVSFLKLDFGPWYNCLLSV